MICIKKRGGHYNPNERITHVGVATNNGHLVYSHEQLITWIEAGLHRFYVKTLTFLKEIQVDVAIRNGRKYLKTQADGEEPNNLLALPEC